jgi:hypothetical protein
MSQKEKSKDFSHGARAPKKSDLDIIREKFIDA